MANLDKWTFESINEREVAHLIADQYGSEVTNEEELEQFMDEGFYNAVENLVTYNVDAMKIVYAFDAFSFDDYPDYTITNISQLAAAAMMDSDLSSEVRELLEAKIAG